LIFSRETLEENSRPLATKADQEIKGDYLNVLLS